MNYQLIKQQYNINDKDNIIDQILTNRGISDVDHYLHTTKEDILSPLLLDNMMDGVKMLICHIYAQDDIFIQVDSDCDGATAAALLINYLYSVFPSYVPPHIHYRLHTGKQHGLIPSTIGENIKLVIAPDSSSNDYAEHEELHNRGVDILILDHHEADKISPNACVINNQLCNYPNKSLSGVGIVYKFCCAIDSVLQNDAISANNFLDLAAVGIIGDMMDLREFENKEIISLGLNKIQNPFLMKMKEMQAYSIDKHGYFDPFAVAFYIVPLINAIFRSGTPAERLLMFEAMLSYKAYEQIPSTKRGCSGQTETRVEQAVRTCKNVKSRQTRTNDDLLDMIELQIKRDNLLDHKFLIICLEDVIDNKNLTGLIANQLASKYQRPTLILNHTYSNDDSDIWTWEGSGRNYPNSIIPDLRQLIADTNLALYAQGHGNAFGVGFEEDKLPIFIQTIDEKYKDTEFTITYYVDKIYNSNNFNAADVLAIAELKSIWGQGLPEPMIAIENLAVHSGNVDLRSPDKYPTLIIKLTNGVELIKFGSSAEELDKFLEQQGVFKINVVGYCDRNIWGTSITPQIKIEDYEIASHAEYYF